MWFPTGPVRLVAALVGLVASPAVPMVAVVVAVSYGSGGSPWQTPVTVSKWKCAANRPP